MRSSTYGNKEQLKGNEGKGDCLLYASFPVFLVTKSISSRNSDLHSSAYRNQQLNYVALTLLSSRFLCHSVASLYSFFLLNSSAWSTLVQLNCTLRYSAKKVKRLFPLKWERSVKSVGCTFSSREGENSVFIPKICFMIENELSWWLVRQ